ncbi:GNAT family N-acetyltransferase [Streptomyces sp. TLI_171]|uniref:GNAT family N-acetyltransferase n=1 Tax=Streptomyces sp. TLI_171 TaxID=1938859 RepID=UPI000C17420E|nr:GNAT family N-acetyltransferase [Streptomyces sp. TLI_171]RKE17029.1 ribosomal protein S18 acetylase RimI-like enzyme [Streptomyces sp. TLI_171]
MAEVRLPDGYTAHPIDPAADRARIHALAGACRRALDDAATADPDALATVLARTGLDPAADVVLIHAPDGSLAAWAWTDRRTAVAVHPAHRGRGLGAALLEWTERRALERGDTVLTQTVDDRNPAATALLHRHGYRPRATNWLLEIPLDGAELPPPPAGVTVRPIRVGDAAEEQAVHRLTEEAFGSWSERRRPFEEWAGFHLHRSTFAPERSPVALVDGRPVGAALALELPGSPDGYVETLAVHHDHRHRGIARHLLQYSFRACHLAGLRSGTLWTHSGTGALDLYLKLGMTIRRSTTVVGRTLVAD